MEPGHRCSPAIGTIIPSIRQTGRFIAVLGFASADYAAMALTGVYLGAVNVPLQASAPARQHADIIAETQPRVLAASILYIAAAVEAVLLGTVRRAIWVCPILASTMTHGNDWRRPWI